MLSGGVGVYEYWGKQPDNHKICPEMGSVWSNNLVTTCTQMFNEAQNITNLDVGNCSNGKWSSWLDRDDENFSGDHELIQLFFANYQNSFDGTDL